MKVLISGCFGFIASNLIPFLLNKGNIEVIGIDNLLNPSIDPSSRIKSNCNPGSWERFKFWNADIRDLQNIYSILINEKPDYVIHLAALGSVPRSWDQPGVVTDINERGFINMLQASTATKVKRFVFASSSSVYGPTDKNIKWEGSQLFPASPYALTKVNNERFCDLWCGNMGMEWMALRFFNVYGPGQRFDSNYSAVIPKFIKEETININGDGLTIRDFTYVSDVCYYLFQSLISKKHSLAVNIGSGYGTNLNKLAEIISERFKKEKVYKDPRPNDAKISIADTARLFETLGEIKMTSIEQGLSKTMYYYDSL